MNELMIEQQQLHTYKTKIEWSWNRACVWVSDLSLSRLSRANVRKNANNPKMLMTSLANLKEKGKMVSYWLQARLN